MHCGRYGIQYQLGTGTTAYLMMLWYLGVGYTVASLLALPAIYGNVLGRRLDELGVVSVYYEFLGGYNTILANS